MMTFFMIFFLKEDVVKVTEYQNIFFFGSCACFNFYVVKSIVKMLQQVDNFFLYTLVVIIRIIVDFSRFPLCYTF